jgi:uncharacterized protein YdbL (DUF1318 family)
MKTTFPYLFAFLAMIFLAGNALASPVSQAQERIKERLAQVDALKAEGKAGESFNGYLSARGELSPREFSLIEAENADRRILYEAVARSTGQTPEEVGRQRAIRIAELAREGVWLQDPDGSWYRKDRP